VVKRSSNKALYFRQSGTLSSSEIYLVADEKLPNCPRISKNNNAAVIATSNMSFEVQQQD